jgi:YD repeat-containing protein
MSVHHQLPSLARLSRPTFFYSLATPATSPITSTTMSFLADLGAMCSGSSSIANFRLNMGITRFDAKGDAIESSDLKGGGGNVYSAKIIDPETGNTLAEAQNARFQEIAYCGFESDYSPWPTMYNGGNWNFNPVAITTSHGLLGRCAFHCSSSGGTTLSTTGILQTGHDYYVSFWVLAGGSILVNDGTSPVTTSPVATYTVPATGEVWTLYKCRFMATGTTIGMWGEGYIDEIKVYPINCLMQTHNFLPLVGKTSDVDQKDNVTTYEYDPFGNLSVVRDQNGNVLSKSKTVNQGY